MLKTRIAITLMAMFVCIESPPFARGSGCPGSPDQSHGPDVMIGNLWQIKNFAAVDTVEALTIGTDACNLGDQVVSWEACPATTHPVFGSNLYKWSTVDGATRFEQVGQSWLKHGFGADQKTTCCTNCIPYGSLAKLGLGCSDAYSAGQAGVQTSLSPKYMVNAHTGIYSSSMCGMHPYGGSNGRTQVEIADLEVTSGGEGAAVRYFGQSQYITADDAAAHNQNNNASSRELIVNGGGTNWTFSFTSSYLTNREIPAIRLWKTIDANVSETDVDTPEDDGFPGLVILAAKASDLGNGYWRYEYAVNNLNSDRSIGAFSVPCSHYADVQNIGFHDVSYRAGDGLGGVNYDGTDWPGVFAGSAVSWATTPFDVNPNANAIRWGTLYNFRFDADLAPAGTSGDVKLQEFKATVDLTASTVVPSTISCTKGDVNGDGFVDGADIELFEQILVNGGATHSQKCAADAEAVPNGAVDDSDVEPFVNCVLAGGCP